MNEKVAIITFNNVYNYGAILQEFALNNYLNSIGCNCNVINYDSKVLAKPYKLFSSKEIKIFFKQLILYPLQKCKINKFKRFINRYIKITNRLDRKKLNEEIKKYDFIITGSDQVWNTDITKEDKDIYLLDFNTNAKKIAYAASFGKDTIEDNERDYFRKHLKTYDYISVREKTGLEILEDLGINNQTEVLDPTFLLSKEDWIKKLKLKEKKKKYILLYMLGSNKKLIEFSKHISGKLQLPIVSFDYKMKKNKYISGPKEFVDLILNSEMVLTNSFHGVALSIIFNKQFFVALNSKRNSRIIDLLEKLHLNDRIIGENNNGNINYNEVNKYLDKEIQKSKMFLEDIV